MNKETVFYFYEVTFEYRNSSCRYVYGLLRPAKAFFDFLKKDGTCINLCLRCVCHRYDNHGELYTGYGSFRKDAYKQSLPYSERLKNI